jgi:hypothetical protein
MLYKKKKKKLKNIVNYILNVSHLKKKKKQLAFDVVRLILHQF